MWNLNLEDITYQDILEFCQQQVPEGMRLDYKRDIPGNLVKTIAAFANTLGGIIVLGVADDPKTNTPDFPLAGMPPDAGYPARIIQKCQERIYPPVLPSFSPVVTDPEDDTKSFLVIRIDQSLDAPHVIEKKTKVYVRIGDVSQPMDKEADIDRILALAKRRESSELARESLIRHHLDRSARVLPNMDRKPFIWMAVAPLFSHGDLCTLEVCRDGVFTSTPLRAPHGYMGIGDAAIGDDRMSRIRVSMSGSGRKGELFHLEVKYRDGMDNWDFAPVSEAMMTLRFLLHCSSFYGSRSVAHPGTLQISLGVGNAFNSSMHTVSGRGGAGGFPDREFRIDRVITSEKLFLEDSRLILAADLMGELMHAFGLDEPGEHVVTEAKRYVAY